MTRSLVWLFLQLACSALFCLPGSAQTNLATKPALIVIKGAGGEEDFGKQFSDWAALWENAARKAPISIIKIGFEPTNATPDRELLENALSKEPRIGSAELWIVLLGHGTFDGKEAKFNLRGPDFSSTELAKWLEPFQRPLAVIDTSSASGPFLNKLSRKNRVIITSTRSGHEQNFARFGQYLSEAIGDVSADLDKDGQTSLLEAYLMASRRLTAWYESEGRLATEHPLLDDNGDGHGTPPDWFRGIYAVKKSSEGAELDGSKAHQWHLVKSGLEQNWSPELRAKRDAIEQSIAALRQLKAQMKEDEYYEKLEPLLTNLAGLYENQSSQKQSSNLGTTER
jgi:hypothetical protein